MKKVVLVLALCGALAPSLLSAQTDSLPNGTGSPGSVVLDDSWRLWLDEKADWKNDTLYLPDEVDLAKLPVNPPTGGWDALNEQAGIPVTLPGTVEEHYWDKAPLPVAKPDWPGGIVNLASPYLGVSWWYRTFTPTDLVSGERLVFHFPGARMRAEVYINGKLVAYNLVTETPFDADATGALKPGPNQIAVRITNPGGNFAWVDYGVTQWGKYTFTNSHGFGGIDGGVTMAVHGPVVVNDLFVANNPDPHTVTFSAEIASSGPAYKGPLALGITRDGKDTWSGTIDADVPAGGRVTVTKQVTVPDAELWDIGHPVLYQAAARIASIPHSDRTTDFGFRWFNAEGLGDNAHLALNGKRIVVKSAISWGFWAPNGMFPDKAAVQREIDAVHALGLNCVQNHRHFPKADVLDGFDHAGILRYCEPGGGGGSFNDSPPVSYPKGPIDTSGAGGDPVTFSQRYATVKLLSMIKAYRSHPSALLWTIQNETGADLHNPKIFGILRKMRALDPSRIILLKSGFDPNGEVMGLPYTDTWAYGEKNTDNDSGWHDTHTCNDYEGVYLDQFYKGPTDYTYYTTEPKAISAWGEMATGASVDNVTSIAKWYSDHNVPGYDREAAETLSAAYEKFLDEPGFRAAYPTAETLFKQIGDKHYFSAARVMENARIADANDYIVLSGWESTTIDNHCALVDALRQPKGDPAMMHAATEPELLVVRPLHYVVAKGDAAVADVHIVNEVNRHGAFTLQFTAAMDSAKDQPFFTQAFPVNVTGGNVFGESLKEGISFTPPAAGPVTMTASLVASGDTKPVLQRTEPLLVVDTKPAPIAGTIAFADFNGTLAPVLQKQFGVTAVPLDSAPAKVDDIIISSNGAPRFALDLNNVQRTQGVQNTDDPGLYAEESVGLRGDVAKISGLAPGTATVEMFFVDSYFVDPTNRAFRHRAEWQDCPQEFRYCRGRGWPEQGGREEVHCRLPRWRPDRFNPAHRQRQGPPRCDPHHRRQRRCHTRSLPPPGLPKPDRRDVEPGRSRRLQVGQGFARRAGPRPRWQPPRPAYHGRRRCRRCLHRAR